MKQQLAFFGTTPSTESPSTYRGAHVVRECLWAKTSTFTGTGPIGASRFRVLSRTATDNRVFTT